MKALLLATILFLVLVSDAQERSLRLADTLIKAMKKNPACMITPK